MQYIKQAVGPLAANAYILFNPERDDAIVIDPGAEPETIRDLLGGRKLSAILLTHGHGDHIGAVRALREGGVPVYIHRLDAPMLQNGALSLADMVGTDADQGAADVLLEEGDIDVAGLPITVLHTPGHTPGSVCFQCGDDIFSGDTLFRQGYGRTDFPGGDMRQMGQSLKRLLRMDKGLRIHPGHGESTSIGEEGRYHL